MDQVVMMSGQVSYLGILKAAVVVGAVPGVAELSPKGIATWERDGLRITAWIRKENGRELEWYINIDDAKLGELLSKSGRMEVRVRSRVILPIVWPDKITSQIEEYLCSSFGDGSTIVSDRVDLCMILAEPDEVERASFYFWQDRMNFPSRLVKALVLARDMEDSALEKDILGKLGSLKGIPVPQGFNGDMLAQAKQWAKRYSREMKREISI